MGSYIGIMGYPKPLAQTAIIAVRNDVSTVKTTSPAVRQLSDEGEIDAASGMTFGDRRSFAA